MMPRDEEAQPARLFHDLPPKTQEFLAELRDEDISTLEKGLELVRAVLTVGRFLRWVAIAVLALLLGAVSLYENVMKIFGWINQPK